MMSTMYTQTVRMNCFGPAVINREIAKYPDELYQWNNHENDWPELDGIVLVLFASRSGSTAFSRTAEANFNVSGVGESLNIPAIQRRMLRHKTPNMTTELCRYVKLNSSSSWFMFKAGGPGVINAERIGFMTNYETAIRPVLLLRKDVISQAISYVTAKISGRYHSTQAIKNTVTVEDYSAELLSKAVNTIINSSYNMARYSEKFSHPRSIMFYEQFKDDDKSAILECLSGLGVPKRQSECASVVQVKKLKKQNSEHWIERFNTDMSPQLRQKIQSYRQFVKELESNLGEVKS